jgi:hypothetical protein
MHEAMISYDLFKQFDALKNDTSTGRDVAASMISICDTNESDFHTGRILNIEELIDEYKAMKVAKIPKNYLYFKYSAIVYCGLNVLIMNLGNFVGRLRYAGKRSVVFTPLLFNILCCYMC